MTGARPDLHGAWAAAGWGAGSSWREAADAALDRLYETGGSPWVNVCADPGAPARDLAAHAVDVPKERRTDLVLVFVTAGFRADFGRILDHLKGELGAAHVVGCSATHGIAGGRVLEGREAITVLAMIAPGVVIRSLTVTPEVVERAAGLADDRGRQAAFFHEATGIPPGEANGWLLLADHAAVDAATVASLWSAAYPGEGVTGAIASTSGEERMSALFHQTAVVPDGLVAVAIGGAWAIDAVTSQGCSPIGRPWTITEVDGDHGIRRIGRKPALGVLMDTVRELPASVIERARGNLFAGLAIDEVSSATVPTHLVSCALLGADQESGSILVLGRPVVGQTLQFQYRDAHAATADLEARMQAAAGRHAARSILAAIALVDDARHQAFFGTSDRDAATIRGVVTRAAIGGFGCRAEVGSVGGRLVALTHAACIGLIVPARPA